MSSTIRSEREHPGMHVPASSTAALAVRQAAVPALYASLAVIFLWIGGMKFTSYEAQGVAPFIMNNPLLTWLHSALGVGGGTMFLGVFEVVTGILLLARWYKPGLAAIGGSMAVVTFLLTLSCMFTTPGVAAQEAGGFPALSAEIGQFLLKDLGLLAISVFVVGDALAEQSRRA